MTPNQDGCEEVGNVYLTGSEEITNRLGLCKLNPLFPTNVHSGQSATVQQMAGALHTLALSYSNPVLHKVGNDLETHISCCCKGSSM